METTTANVTCKATCGTYRCTKTSIHSEHACATGISFDGRVRVLHWGTTAGERWTLVTVVR